MDFFGFFGLYSIFGGGDSYTSARQKTPLEQKREKLKIMYGTKNRKTRSWKNNYVSRTLRN